MKLPNQKGLLCIKPHIPQHQIVVPPDVYPQWVYDFIDESKTYAHMISGYPGLAILQGKWNGHEVYAYRHMWDSCMEVCNLVDEHKMPLVNHLDEEANVDWVKYEDYNNIPKGKIWELIFKIGYEHGGIPPPTRSSLAESWDYPVKPGTSEWIELGST
jgi:hypothetical protein